MDGEEVGGNGPPTSARSSPTLLAEITSELVAARRRLVRDDVRVRALEDLTELVRATERVLGRPASLVDLLAAGGEPGEQQRRLALLRRLRNDL